MVLPEIDYAMIMDQLYKEIQPHSMNQEMIMNLMKVINPNDEQMILEITQ
jgi:hypothetical protein